MSTPTVVRLVQKLGFRGYPEFQASVARRGRGGAGVAAGQARALGGRRRRRPISSTASPRRWLGNLQATLGRSTPPNSTAPPALLADPARKVFAVGGRITHALADYLVTHLSLIRPGVTLIADAATGWPPALLDMAPGDVLIAFDIRRYENAVLNLVEMAAGEGAEVVLFTDQWVSPASTHATRAASPPMSRRPRPGIRPRALMVLVETLLAAVQALTPDETVRRMRRLEALLAQGRLFRKTRG